jgi:cytoskeletal protein RodZ
MNNEQWKMENKHPRGLSHWGVLAFLVIFVILLLAVSYWFLFPAIAASQHATPAERRRIGAYAWLLLALVLIVLFFALVLIFRVGRFFFPRKLPPRTQTSYVDAWAESAKRIEMPTDEEDDATE